MDYNKLIELRKIIIGRIEEILQDGSFKLDSDYLIAIHKYLFDGIYDYAGMFRTYNVSKKESVLYGDSVIYPDYHDIVKYLEYDIEEEKGIKYNLLPLDKRIKRITSFTSRIWMTHPFCEGNTRTTCVFIEKYLKSMGYDITNQVFKDNSGFLRDALVIACYYNTDLGIHMNDKPLKHFFEKVLIDPNIYLSDSELEIKEFVMPTGKVRKLERK